MTLFKSSYILCLVLLFTACNTRNEVVAVEISETTTSPVVGSAFEKLIERFATQQTPFIDTTNFDNFNLADSLHPEEKEVLQIREIEDGYEEYVVYPNYSLHLSDNFLTLVILVFKGDHELESILLNFEIDGDLIDAKVVAYDEIAEGWSSKHAVIAEEFITIVDLFYGDELQVDSSKFHINRQGYINQIDTKFTNFLRPNQNLHLGEVYTDTVEFISYSDGGDYSYMKGQIENEDFSLIYFWDWYENENYDFKTGDNIQMQWQIDSIYIAGDGGTLTFATTAIDAKKIDLNEDRIVFLRRKEQYDEEFGQTFSHIVLHESFIQTCSPQEKAALAYEATFIGNDCSWDGDANATRSNLKCQILTAFNLGYQCSAQHLGYLQQWFALDSIALQKLETCSIIPNTATVQNTFDEIVLWTDEDTKSIVIHYKANAINMREGASWTWTQKDTFNYTAENIYLSSSNKSEAIVEEFKLSED